MEVNELSPKRREAYVKISEYVKKHGGAVSVAAKNLGLPASQYYQARRLLTGSKFEEPKRKYNRKPKLETIPVAPATFGKLTMVTGTPQELAELMRLMK